MTTDQHLSLVDHLGELRTRLVRILIILLIAGIACYNWSEKIFDWIRLPISTYLPEHGLVFTGLADKFIAHIKISVFAGVLFSCPFWLYQVWAFIAPGLYSKEKKYTIGFIFTGALLFFAGAALCYFTVMPVACEFLIGFGGNVDKPMITIDEYLSFFMALHLVFGLTFEIPLILVVLGMLGLVSHEFLKRTRRYAVVILSVLAGVLTPSPDALSMMLLLVPMVILYEIAIIAVGIFERKRKENT
jgi:sec-independent protein translocase protein TatC